MEERIYNIPHNLRPIIYVPYRAIVGNIDFLSSDKPKIKTQDNYMVYCKAEEVLTADLLQDVKKIYNMNIIQFIETWEDRLGKGCILDFLIKITILKS